MTALLEQMVASGTTYVRTYTDVVTDHGLAGVEAVWAAQERLGGRVTIEQVAFPQYGVLADPGTSESMAVAGLVGRNPAETTVSLLPVADWAPPGRTRGR